MVPRVLVVLGVMAAAAGAPALLADEAPEAAPEFTEAFMSDPANIQVGKDVWVDQCRHCHGAKAYPGKAPKLKPRRYSADFVFDRVSNGFRKMPAWKEVFSEQEIMGVTAYILSDDFSP